MSVASDFFLKESHRFSKFVDPGDKYEAWTIRVDKVETTISISISPTAGYVMSDVAA